MSSNKPVLMLKLRIGVYRIYSNTRPGSSLLSPERDRVENSTPGFWGGFPCRDLVIIDFFLSNSSVLLNLY